MPVEGYAVNWTAVVIAAVIGTAAMGVMILGSVLLAPRRPSAAKAIPYESGIKPTPLAWTQFTVRYYIFAILFLIFDVEAVFLFPWAMAVSYTHLRAHETVLDLVCRLLLEKKKKQ